MNDLKHCWFNNEWHKLTRVCPQSTPDSNWRLCKVQLHIALHIRLALLFLNYRCLLLVSVSPRSCTDFFPSVPSAILCLFSFLSAASRCSILIWFSVHTVVLKQHHRGTSPSLLFFLHLLFSSLPARLSVSKSFVWPPVQAEDEKINRPEVCQCYSSSVKLLIFRVCINFTMWHLIKLRSEFY